MYRRYKISRPNSKRKREICEPISELKEFQGYLKEELDNVPLSEYAHGFVTGRSPVTNAMCHRGQRYVLNLDIKDFFPSISKEKLMSKLRCIFLGTNFDPVVLDWIEELCFLDGGLPQGAPSSPVLSNIYLLDFDYELAGYISGYGFNYSRYVDDITISGDDAVKQNAGLVVGLVSRLLGREELRLNNKKTKLMPYFQKQMVNGILVNNLKLSLPRITKQALVIKYKFTRVNDLTHEEKGYLEYVRSVDPFFYGRLMKMFQAEDTIVSEA